MLDKIKAFFSVTWNVIAFIAMAIIGILTLGYLSKSGKLDSVEAQLGLAKTTSGSDAIDKDVAVINAKKENNQEDINQDKDRLAKLEKDKQAALDKQKDTTIEDNLDFWNNK